MRLALALACAIAAAAPAGSQTPERQIGSGEFEARKGDFAALVLLTLDEEEFLKAWNGPTPPHLPTSEEVRRGRPITAMLLFSGCKADERGKCALTADFLITAPDDSVYDQHKGAKVWDDAPAPVPNIQLSITNLTIVIEPGEQIGRYGVRIRLTDGVAKTSLDLATTFTVLEAEPPAPTS